MDIPIIRARRITKVYDRPGQPMTLFWRTLSGKTVNEPWHRVLDGIDIDIHHGETVGVLGSNGVGKTTLLSILAGVKSASSGTVRRHGRIIPILELGGSFSIERTGKENVIAFARSHGVLKAGLPRLLWQCRDFADIGDYFDRPLRTYSSGMRSRLAFAAAMSLDGDLVMLDETLAVGDPSFRMKCYELIQARQAMGTSFLLVSHNANTLASLCSRILVMDNRKIVYDGPPIGAVMAYKAVRSGLDPDAGSSGHPASPVSVSFSPAMNSGNSSVSGKLVVRPAISIDNTCLHVGVLGENGTAIGSFQCNTGKLDAGSKKVFAVQLDNILRSGKYHMTSRLVSLAGDQEKTVFYNPKIHVFSGAHETSGTGMAELDFRVEAGSTAAAS